MTLLLIAANAALAWLMTALLFGPDVATMAAAGAIAAMLVLPGMNAQSVLRRSGGRVLRGDEWLAQVVAVLAQRAGLSTMPTVVLLPGRQPNAMAVGDRRNGAVAVTEGAVTQLSDAAVAGVLAHEVAHLQHGDTRLLSISATAARVTNFLAQLTIFIGFISLPFVLFGAVRFQPTLFILAMIAPVVAIGLQMALSRRREFAADRRAGELTGDPAALAHALAQLEQLNTARMPPWLRHYAGQGPVWLRSHPPTQQRITALQVQPANPALRRCRYGAPGATRYHNLVPYFFAVGKTANAIRLPATSTPSFTGKPGTT